MLTREAAERDNQVLLERLSLFLNLRADSIDGRTIAALRKDFAFSSEEAYAFALAAQLGFRIDECPEERELFEAYFPRMLHREEQRTYRNTPYARLRFSERSEGRWRMTKLCCRPFELFVRDDPLCLPDGRVIPQLGYFEEPYFYPAVLEDGREWMTVTPNEVNTMRSAVEAAQGDVLTFGLGLGYFALLASEKETVRRVTVVERDETVLSLFRRFLLPQFPHREKLELIQADAFAYAAESLPRQRFDLVFTDLWHDAGDGVPLYLRMKALEARSPQSRFLYWIEPTLALYLLNR